MNAYPSLNVFMMFLQKWLEINHFLLSSLSPLPPCPPLFLWSFNSQQKELTEKDEGREKMGGRENVRELIALGGGISYQTQSMVARWYISRCRITMVNKKYETEPVLL